MSDSIDQKCLFCTSSASVLYVHGKPRRRVTCGKAICESIRSAIRDGEHVHDVTACFVCGDLYTNKCPATDPLIVEREPRLVRESEL